MHTAAHTPHVTDHSDHDMSPTMPLTGNHHEHMAAIGLVDPTQATHVAVNSGSWFDPNNWQDGVIPGDDADVFIPHGIEISYGGVSDARVHTIGVEGRLSFDPGADSRLVVDTVVVLPNGGLEIGSQDNPISGDTNVEIIIANNGAIDTNWDAQLLSRGIVSLGDVHIHGEVKDAHTKVATDPMAGDQTITLANGGEGWEVGDTIVIAGTQNKGHFGIGNARRKFLGDTNEERVITAIDGDEITLDRPLEFDHPSPRADLKTSVANYTRSITIRSEDGADSAVHERGHVMFMGSQDVDVRYAAFVDLGRTDKSERSFSVSNLDEVAFDSNVQGRYSLHLHQLGLHNQEDPIIIEGNAIAGSPGWGIAQHSSNANLQNNATLDIFGAAYVSEAGDETGSWIDNISIGTEGVFNIERSHSDVAAGDLGRTGNGFWLQSRLIETVDNVAAAARTGFVWVAQGSSADVDPNLFDQPEAIGLGTNALSRDLPITLSIGNEVFGSERGLTVTKGNPNQGHDIRSVLEDFTAWEVRSGVNAEYTSHYTFRNFDLIGAEHDPRNAPVKDAFHFGNNVSDMVIAHARIDGFEHAYSMTDVFTPSLRATQAQKQFFVVGGDLSNLRDDVFRQSDWMERATLVDPADVSDAPLSVDVTSNAIAADGNYPFVRLTGTKTDSLGVIPVPAGTDDYKLNPPDLAEILRTDGYYTRDGKHVMIVEAYYQDRLTGELIKVGHVVEAAHNKLFGFRNFTDAVYRGELPEENLAAIANDDAAQTASRHPVTINVLANDSDGDSIGHLKVDGLVQPKHGKVFDNGDGTLTYVADYGFTGTDSFEYFATDGYGEFDKAVVTVDVATDTAPHDPNPDPVPDPEPDPDPVPVDPVPPMNVLTGTDGNDRLDGSAEADFILGLLGTDRVFGGEGDDTIDGGGGNDYLRGDSGNDMISGGDGSDQIHGHGGNDSLDGGAGDDVVNGHGGNDLLDGGAGNDLLRGHSGADTLTGGSGDDVIEGGPHNDLLIGGSGADLLFGNTARDRLEGRAGNDTLDGGFQEDLLIGGLGDDVLTGGRDDDVFQFGAGDGNNTITDFETGIDRIDIDVPSIGFDALQIQSTADGATIAFANTSILLVGVDAATLTESDFLF